MPRGGPRVGAGRPKKNAPPRIKAPAPKPSQADAEPKIPAPTAAQDKLEPLPYMLKVMNDPDADPGRRDRMAVAAAPYLHPKAGDTGKKEQKQERANEIAGTGRFAPPAEPIRH